MRLPETGDSIQLARSAMEHQTPAEERLDLHADIALLVIVGVGQSLAHEVLCAAFGVPATPRRSVSAPTAREVAPATSRATVAPRTFPGRGSAR
jgi:hypothetical protein